MSDSDRRREFNVEAGKAIKMTEADLRLALYVERSMTGRIRLRDKCNAARKILGSRLMLS